MEGNGQFNDYIDNNNNSHTAINVSQKMYNKSTNRFPTNKVHIAANEFEQKANMN